MKFPSQKMDTYDFLRFTARKHHDENPLPVGTRVEICIDCGDGTAPWGLVGAQVSGSPRRRGTQRFRFHFGTPLDVVAHARGPGLHAVLGLRPAAGPRLDPRARPGRQRWGHSVCHQRSVVPLQCLLCEETPQ